MDITLLLIFFAAQRPECLPLAQARFLFFEAILSRDLRNPMASEWLH